MTEGYERTLTTVSDGFLHNRPDSGVIPDDGAAFRNGQSRKCRTLRRERYALVTRAMTTETSTNTKTDNCCDGCESDRHDHDEANYLRKCHFTSTDSCSPPLQSPATSRTHLGSEQAIQQSSQKGLARRAIDCEREQAINQKKRATRLRRPDSYFRSPSCSTIFR